MMCQMAEILGEGDVLQKYSAILAKGTEAFERLLWNGMSAAVGCALSRRVPEEGKQSIC